MKPISILNDVLGPVMRGSSSSHTAGPFYIGTLARALLDDEPASVTFTFDPDGSFAEVYRQQGSDLGFALWGMEAPLAYGLSRWLGLEVAGIWWGRPIANLANGLFLAFWFRLGRWKRKEV